MYKVQVASYRACAAACLVAVEPLAALLCCLPRQVHVLCGVAAEPITNNQAEYMGLLHGMQVRVLPSCSASFQQVALHLACQHLIPDSLL